MNLLIFVVGDMSP